MKEEDVKIIIKFPSLGREVETDLAKIKQIRKDLKNKKKRKKLLGLKTIVRLDKKTHYIPVPRGWKRC